MDEDEAPPRQFRPSLLYSVEDIEDYVKGGFHPVHLGDTLLDGRYRIVHKLGAGGFSTVWLARDEIKKTYASLKILQAKASEDCTELKTQEQLERSSSNFGSDHVSLLQDHFFIEGPNGRHAALVYAIAGPSVHSLYTRDGAVRGSYRLRRDLAQKAAFQTTKALEYVHNAGVVHGDLTTSNVLLKIEPIDQLSEDDIYERFGRPVKDNLFRLTQSQDPNSAPEYVVESIDLGKSHPHMLTGDITIIDFGVSFMADTPPADGIGTPAGYQAPEVLFGALPGKASDMWALACTLYEIRAGSTLFAGDFGSDYEALEEIVKTLGELPEPLHEKWKEEYEPDEDLVAGSSSLADRIREVGAYDEESGPGPDHRLTIDLFEKPHTAASEEESLLIKDLLENLLKFNPGERLSVNQICEHPWFSFKT